MEKNLFPITSTDAHSSRRSSTVARKEQARARYERLWLKNPMQFDPERCARERERIDRSWHFLTERFSIKDARVVDLGSGKGVFSRLLHQAGARVIAVDIASRALENLSDTPIESIRDALPDSRLPDDAYDLVVALDLLPEIDPQEYRLFFSELHRIVKKEGAIFVSCAIDFTTENAVERLAELAKTECEIEAWEYSYHRLYFKIRDFFSSPERWAKGWEERAYRDEIAAKKGYFGRIWWRCHTVFPLAWLWALVRYPLRPLIERMRQSRSFLLFLENICRTLSPVRGMSHVLFFAKPRHLLNPHTPIEKPVYRKHKREVWE